MKRESERIYISFFCFFVVTYVCLKKWRKKNKKLFFINYNANNEKKNSFNIWKVIEFILILNSKNKVKNPHTYSLLRNNIFVSKLVSSLPVIL